MGLFGKLFEKKVCDICGGEIGLLGNRKLEDGNICKNCAKGLSYWFSDRRSSTIEEIEAQLAYREENRAAVAAFHTSRRFGSFNEVHIDDEAGKFMVVRTANIEEENPDVIDIASVTGCEMDIDEKRIELFRSEDGKQVSYDPPRYKYSYDFDMLIFVDHPYFSEMRFDLNPGYVDIEPGFLGFGSTRGSAEYREYEQLGYDIRHALLSYVPPVRASAPAPAGTSPAAAPRFCPECGSPTEGAKFCSNCGTKLI